MALVWVYYNLVNSKETSKDLFLKAAVKFDYKKVEHIEIYDRLRDESYEKYCKYPDDAYYADAGEFMVEMANDKAEVDVVFMDPPRAGSDEAFLSSVVKLAPKKVVYVSCNPETLARDLKYLTKHGYKALECQPVDMFPMTKHVESVVVLRK